MTRKMRLNWEQGFISRPGYILVAWDALREQRQSCSRITVIRCLTLIWLMVRWMGAWIRKRKAAHETLKLNWAQGGMGVWSSSVGEEANVNEWMNQWITSTHGQLIEYARYRLTCDCALVRFIVLQPRQRCNRWGVPEVETMHLPLILHPPPLLTSSSLQCSANDTIVPYICISLNTTTAKPKTTTQRPSSFPSLLKRISA